MKGRRALVTGGDSGIGRAAAIAFAREGADVVIACLHPDSEDARSTLALIEEAGNKGWVVISMKNDWKCVFPTEKPETQAANSAGWEPADSRCNAPPGSQAFHGRIRH